MKIRLAAAMLAVGASIGSGCSGPQAPIKPSASESGLRKNPGTAAAIEAGRDAPGANALLALDPAQESTALKTATLILRKFARRSIPAEQWWQELAPHLTISAAAAFSGTAPENIPPTKLTGDPKFSAKPSAGLVEVAIPTNAGVYLVLLSRTQTGPWLATRITPQSA